MRNRIFALVSIALFAAGCSAADDATEGSSSAAQTAAAAPALVSGLSVPGVGGAKVKLADPLASVLVGYTKVKGMSDVGGQVLFELVPRSSDLVGAQIGITSAKATALLKAGKLPTLDVVVGVAKEAPLDTTVTSYFTEPGSSPADIRWVSSLVGFDKQLQVTRVQLRGIRGNTGETNLRAKGNTRYPAPNMHGADTYASFFSDTGAEIEGFRDLNRNGKVDPGETKIEKHSPLGETPTEAQLWGDPGAGTPQDHL